MFSKTALFLTSPIALALATPTATTTGPPAACLYTTLPSYTAYAANMPNPNLTANQIDTYFNDFSFACESGQNFEARLLSTSTLTPKPWFGAIEYSSTSDSQCTPSSFASVVGQAMLYKNSNGNSAVTCNFYTGGTATPFQQAAQQYFESLE